LRLVVCFYYGYRLPGDIRECRLSRKPERWPEVYVRLTCKLANSLDGVDVTKVHVGDVLDLSAAEAAMLIAEGWAESMDAVTELKHSASAPERTG
jgi:hypothetical protein